jgi:hypothetical protein
MTTIETITTTVERPGAGFKVDDARLAAVSFLSLQRADVGGVPP